MQDHSLSWQSGARQIAIVADGHGSRRHFRSQIGSKLACETALEKIRAFLDDSATDICTMDERLNKLKLEICIAWRDAVIADHQAYPWTDDELAEEQEFLSADQYNKLTDGTEVLIPYGSTLCAAFSDGSKWAAIQLGDGGFVHISLDGEYNWPMPVSLINSGNKTASLCQKDPMEDFRHCSGNEHPAGLLVFTDGVDKSFPEQGREIVSFLHWVWNNGRQNGEKGAEALEKTLDVLTEKSKVGDDVSIAGFADKSLPDIKPRLTQRMIQREADKQNAHINELKSSLEYNRKQLAHLRKTDGDPEDMEKISAVISRIVTELGQVDPSYGQPKTEQEPKAETRPGISDLVKEIIINTDASENNEDTQSNKSISKVNDTELSQKSSENEAAFFLKRVFSGIRTGFTGKTGKRRSS